MKEKLTPLLDQYRRINSKPNSFRVLNILYITNFCETRKINSNAIRALFLLLNFREKQEVRPKLGVLKIIFQRGCALNNQGQKLFQLGCALNQDIYDRLGVANLTSASLMSYQMLQNDKLIQSQSGNKTTFLKRKN